MQALLTRDGVKVLMILMLGRQKREFLAETGWFPIMYLVCVDPPNQIEFVTL